MMVLVMIVVTVMNHCDDDGDFDYDYNDDDEEEGVYSSFFTILRNDLYVLNDNIAIVTIIIGWEWTIINLW